MSGDVSTTVSTTSTTVTRRHSYNTRSGGMSSVRNCNVTRRKTNCSPCRRQSASPRHPSRSPKRRNASPRVDPCEEPIYQEVDPDDNCIDLPELNQGKRKNPCRTFVTIFSYLLVLAFVLFVMWSFYVVRQEIKTLEDKVMNLTDGDQKGKSLKNITTSTSNGSSPETMKHIALLGEKCVVNETLNKFQKDPVGRPDYALESSGGRVIDVDAAPYSGVPKKLFFFSFCDNHSLQNLAAAMIRATSSPGECWSFKGQSGIAMIQLISLVRIDSVTLEHIPQNLSPSGTIDSAPKDFKIWASTVPDRGKMQLLGQFRYEGKGNSIETFKIQNDNYYEFVDFEVLSNHGNKDYTCVYRLRVHGTPKKSE